MNWLYKYSLYFAWVIALTGLGLSLYFGEVLDQEPCRLCWYQRVALFPLVLFLGIGTYKDDRKIAIYSLPLVFFGGIFALYQATSQYFPSLHSAVLCGHSAHCSLSVFSLFGLIPFPLVSFIGFAAIAFLLIFARQRDCVARNE